VASLYGLDSSFLAWQSFAARFASQSKSCISRLKCQLQNLQQGSLTCASYLTEAKFLVDQLSAVGKPVDDDDLISFIIGVLILLLYNLLPLTPSTLGRLLCHFLISGLNY
jgi:hypothetical protein